LGLALVMGPIIIGVAMSAVALGVAFSVGAFALSTVFLPLMAFLFFNTLIFGGFFGGFAILGMGLFLPKLLSLIVAGGGLALGWFAVNSLLPKKSSPSQPSTPSKSSDSVIDVDPAEEEARRISAELREFDRMLADRDDRDARPGSSNSSSSNRRW